MIGEVIEDVLAEAIVEHGVKLPKVITLTIDQEPFAALLREHKVPPNLTRKTFSLKVMGVSYEVIVRSENDPEDWLPVLRSDTLH